MRRSRAANAAFPAWSRRRSWIAPTGSTQGGDEILARKDELGRLLSREEGKTLAEGIGETVRAGADLRFLRRRDAAAGRRDGADRAAGHRRRDHPRAGRRRRHHHAVEFPDRHSRLEDRAGALPTATRVVFKPAELVPGSSWAHRRHPASRRPAQGRAQPGHGQGLGRRPGHARQPDVDAITFTGSVGTGKRVAAASDRAHAQVPARNGRQEPAGRARRRRSGRRGRLRGQRRLLLDRPALHGLVAADRRAKASTTVSSLR